MRWTTRTFFALRTFKNLATLFGCAAFALGVFCAALTLHAEPATKPTSEPKAQEPAATAEPSDGEKLVTVAVAREQAKLMHNIYAATLDAIHHHYFHSNKAIIPARAMEDIFSEMSRQTKVKARWISVNTKAMGVDHEPQSDFEKKAAEEIAAGKNAFELVEKGRYYRAAAIPLTDGCISCHTEFFTAIPKSPRYAGLVISVPVREE